jgi:hypothetical protein
MLSWTFPSLGYAPRADGSTFVDPPPVLGEVTLRRANPSVMGQAALWSITQSRWWRLLSRERLPLMRFAASFDQPGSDVHRLWVTPREDPDVTAGPAPSTSL